VSVYTRITRPQLNQFFSAYALGEVVSFEGITDGIDNTNYFVNTTQGDFVLTLFESLTVDDLPHVLKLLSHLGKNSLSCPCPQSDRQGNPLRQLNGKPAAVFGRLSGAATASPSVLHCQEIGLQLASLHRCTQDYVFPIKSGNDLSWCKTVLNKIGVYLSATDRELIDDELAFQAENSPVNLPQGVIHADLFRDNVLFVDDRLSGMLDFYSACTDTLLLDVAITANDWCCDNGMVNAEKLTALLFAYESLRPLEPLEKQHWPTLLRAAALRFWLSRLEHQCYPRPGEITQQKDPLIFRRILLQHRQQTYLSLNLRSTA
jgi:homoserine kinase type II